MLFLNRAIRSCIFENNHLFSWPIRFINQCVLNQYEMRQAKMLLASGSHARNAATHMTTHRLAHCWPQANIISYRGVVNELIISMKMIANECCHVMHIATPTI